jgi:hypothetical protein
VLDPATLLRFMQHDESDIAGYWRGAFRVRSSDDKPQERQSRSRASIKRSRFSSLNAIQQPVEASKVAPNIDMASFLMLCFGIQYTTAQICVLNGSAVDGMTLL